MRTLYFNFNNEVNTFEIHQDDETGQITVPGVDGPTYESIEQFAEMYAVARDVVPENLKNWTLLENGDVVSFVLKAGTAGLSADDIRTPLNEALEDMRTSGAYHPLEVARLRSEVEHAEDIIDALVHSSMTQLANDLYDRLEERQALDATTVEAEPEEVDTRSNIERYLDAVLDKHSTYAAVFTKLLNIDLDSDKAAIMAALDAAPISYSVTMLSQLYEDTMTRIMTDGIGVESHFDVFLILAQTMPESNEAEKQKLITSANLAKRDRLPVTEYIVGTKHIKKTPKSVPVIELNEMSLYVDELRPIVIVFNPDIDEELEREKAEEEARREAEEAANGLEYDEYDADEDDYDDEGDENDYDYEGFGRL